jgi:hypothetical protein
MAVQTSSVSGVLRHARIQGKAELCEAWACRWSSYCDGACAGCEVSLAVTVWPCGQPVTAQVP